MHTVDYNLKRIHCPGELQYRFRDGSHGSEPDCAVREAVSTGDIPVKRLEHCLKQRGTAKKPVLMSVASTRPSNEKLIEVQGGRGHSGRSHTPAEAWQMNSTNTSANNERLSVWG